MRKLLFVAVITLMVIGCSKYGKGGDNAIQYLKEAMPEVAGNAESLNILDEGKCFIVNLDSCKSAFIVSENSRTAKQIDTLLNKSLESFFNDSLASAMSGPGERLFYNIEIVAKSTKKKYTSVIMDKDGTTPWMTYEEYVEKMDKIRDLIFDYVINGSVEEAIEEELDSANFPAEMDSARALLGY